ncbi:MAG TPA: putative metal-dependent hydrolase [Terriglobales bacterium]|nr:putative metal-dependent hydrolase [Terriglobales bacterium]
MGDLRYPIGKFEWVAPETEEQAAKDRARYIEVLAKTPLQMRFAVQGLDAEQLNTPYRPEGWTVRQVVHHVPDSHLNAYLRFKLALTEEQPQIKPYSQDAWAKLPDNYVTPIEVSLQLLAALHSRWVDLLQAMRPSDFGRTLFHPEHGVLTLDRMLAMYAWHSSHHLAHITSLRERMQWNRRAAAQQ